MLCAVFLVLFAEGLACTMPNAETHVTMTCADAHVLSVCKQPLAVADNAADLQLETTYKGQEVWNVLSAPSTAADFANYKCLVFLCCHGHVLFHLICMLTFLSTDHGM